MIATFGLMSNGILAQSVGGGGGNGGFAVSGALSLGGDAAANTTGGSGGTGQDAGTVMVTNTGNIQVGAGGQRSACSRNRSAAAVVTVDLPAA